MLETANHVSNQVIGESRFSTLREVGLRAQDFYAQGADADDIAEGLYQEGVVLNIHPLTSVSLPAEMVSFILRVVDSVNGYSSNEPTQTFDPQRRIVICAGGSL